MSIGSFEYVDTTSPGKRKAVAFQTRKVKKAFPNGFKEYILGLPGRGAQCSRHVTEYAKYGIKSRKKIFVDYDYGVYQSQLEWKEATNLRVKIICDNILDALESEWKRGKPIDFIDYDGTSLLNISHVEILRRAAQHDVKAVVIVMTTRAPHLSDYLEECKQRFNVKKEWLGPSKGWRDRIRKISEVTLRDAAKEYGFDCEFLGYPGRKCGAPPMLSCVFINKKFIKGD
ncbi:hypothetical protein LCGC14_1528990 [marine sediment metagenome]|uniref:Uncharacterized protein n=1 Tax=marine sediment metagenome TaxID=412755 RepID=A0A0F9JH78_9ZZZZ